MSGLKNGDYMKLINCNSEDEVLEKVKSWSLGLSDREHLVRSTILDIQASLEGSIKILFYLILVNSISQGNNENRNPKAVDELYQTITKMNFSSVYRILKPILNAFPNPDFDSIPEINDLRNHVAHSRALGDISYKGRNPFNEADSLAQLFLDSWAARNALQKFYERIVEDPAALSAYYTQEHHEETKKNIQNDNCDE